MDLTVNKVQEGVKKVNDLNQATYRKTEAKRSLFLLEVFTSLISAIDWGRDNKDWDKQDEADCSYNHS